MKVVECQVDKEITKTEQIHQRAIMEKDLKIKSLELENLYLKQ